MNAQRFFLNAINYTARVLGIFWILGGIVFAINAYVTREGRWLYFAIATLLLISGVALILVKPVKFDAIEKVRVFTVRLENILRK